MLTEESVRFPLCVDLDGTLIRSDLLHESFVSVLTRRPWAAAQASMLLLRSGKAPLKDFLARQANVDITKLPYDEKVITWLKGERSQRSICLVTASHERFAKRVADHLGIFDEVIASNAQVNLRGSAKASRLVDRFGRHGFDYLGNESIDLRVWSECRLPIAANVSPSLARALKRMNAKALVLSTSRFSFRPLLRALRPHQWTKNALIFVPLLLAHRLYDWSLIARAATTFLAFSLIASAVYVINDLVDLENDRRHPVKRTRPFASGSLPIALGVFAPIALLAVGLTLAMSVSPKLAEVLIGYFALTCLYSFKLKKVAIADVILLGCLYAMRLFAGGYGLDVPLSQWLLAFSLTLFSSLALAKRVTELHLVAADGNQKAPGRGYVGSDREHLAGTGAAAGYMSLAILMLYISSDDVKVLYRTPGLLWLICPLIQYWIGRIWLLANRGELHSDPIVFTLRDPTSYVVGAASAAIAWLASSFVF